MKFFRQSTPVVARTLQATPQSGVDDTSSLESSLESNEPTTIGAIQAAEPQVSPVMLRAAAARRHKRLLKFSLFGLVLLGAFALLVTHHAKNDTTKLSSDVNSRYGTQSIPLAAISSGSQASLSGGGMVSVNGQLNVNNSVVLAPIKQPTGAVAGQLYYDKTSNQLAFYNGKSFDTLAVGSNVVSSIGGVKGDVTLGNGLGFVNNQLSYTGSSNSGVLSVQGETGNVTLTAGGGIAIDGTTLSNSGVVSLGGQNGSIALGSGLSLSGGSLKNSGVLSAAGGTNITVTNDGNGNITISSSAGGSGTVSSPGGTIGRLAKFTGVQTIADSLIGESGTTVTVNGDLTVTGNLALGSPLSVLQGGTSATTASGARGNLGAAASGANSDITSLSGLTTALSVMQGGSGVGTLATNGVLIGNGTSPITAVTGTAGQCLMATVGAPAFQACPGSGGGGVTSLDGLSGALTLANSSGTGATVTINDASTIAKGIASFNATNFLVSTGAVNTVQDIAVTSTPTFAGLNLSAPLGIGSGGTGGNSATNARSNLGAAASGANSDITSLSGLTTALSVLQGGTGTTSLTANGVLLGNGSSPITSVSGTAGQCLVATAGAPVFTTCPGSGGVTSLDGLTGVISLSNSSGSAGIITLDNASTAQKGIASFSASNFSVTAGAVNTIQNIGTAASPTFNGLTLSGALSVNTISPTAAAVFGVTTQNLTLQGASTTITSTSGVNTATLRFVAPTANVTYNLQTATGGTYDICTTAGNCVGTGGGVTSSGGTNNKLAKFTGSQTIADSLVSDNGTTVTVGGDLSVTGNLNLTNPLSVANGGTGTTSFGANSVVIGNGSGALSSATTATPGQCLVSTAGTPTFSTCPGSGGVTSVNGLTGVIVVANASGSGSTITINDASTASKGIASFNSTNFSVASGAVNTVQNINTTAAPAFGQLTLTSSQATNPMLLINNTNVVASGNLLDLQLNGTSKFSVAPNGNVTTVGTITSGTINGQTISSSANFTGSVAIATTLNVNAITPTGSLTVGASGQSFLLQGNASSSLTAKNGASTTTVAFQNPTANVTYNFATAAGGSYDICTTAGNCAGVGGGVTTAGGTTNKLAKFTSSSGIGDSIITDNGSTVTVGGTLSVNTLTPTAALTVGATGQNLTLQGATVSLSANSGGITNSLTFATPASSNKTVTIPNASGTVAVSASGPLSLDAFGNLSCATCLTSGGGGGSAGVSSLNTLTGALVLQGVSAGSISNAGSTITINDATSGIKGLASFNATNLTVTSGNVNTVQDIAVTSTPTFAGLNLSTALSVANGGTGSTTAGGARTNLGAAASGTNSDITSLTGLTTALSTAQGGTGITTTAANGQILIGNGSGYSLNTLTAGSGVNITNGAGTITISAPGSGTCASCANTALSNLASVAINTSLLPGSAAGANLGSATLPFGQLFLAGTSASPATNNFKFTGASTGGTRTLTLPDASGTVAVSASGYLNLNASTGNLSFVGPLAVTDGGTGASSSSGARTNLGAAASGANSDITSITGLTTALAINQGGTAATTASGARSNLGAAASGANSDITSITGLTTALSVVQGGTGAASLTANGILMGNGTGAITAITSGGAGQCLVSTAGAPVFTTCPGSGGVTSVNGQTGVISIANASAAAGTITISNAKADASTKGIATFNATNFTDNGSGLINTIQGIATTSSPTFAGLTLSTALSVANGGTGASSFTNTNGVTYYDGTKLVTSNVGTTGQCLLGNTGAAPSFGTCTGAGGVSSLDSLAGALTLANSSGVGSTITINNAKADGSTKGIATFNSTNFSDNGSGVINTIQGISTSATPTFGGLTLSSALTVGNGGTGATTASGARTNLGTAASGANSDITSLSGLTTALSVLQGGTGAASLTANGVLIGNGTSAITAVTGTTGQCLLATTGSAPSFGTCTGAGGVSSLDTLTGALTLANSSGVGSTITINNAKADSSTKGISTFNSSNFADNGSGLISIKAGGVTTTEIADGTIADTDLATGTFTHVTGTGALTAGSIASGFGTISTSNNISTTAAIQGGTGTFTGTNSLTLGTASTNTGSIKLFSSAGSGSVSLSLANPGTNNFSLSIPTLTNNDTICTVILNNCVGAGATSVGALDGGTANANGATISANTLFLQSASTSFAGLVNTTTQSFAGNKTFSGNVAVTNTSSTAFQVQDAVSNPVLVVNTSSDVNNYFTNPGFEAAGTANWAAKAGASFSRSTAQHYSGQAAMSVTTTATANDGVKYPITFLASTAYNFSFNVYGSSTFSTLAAGYSSNGATDTPATLSCTSVPSGAWTHCYTSFTTPGSFSGSPYVYIKQTDAVSRTFYIDNVELDTKALGGLAVSGGYSDARVSYGSDSSTIANIGIGTSTPNAAIEIDQKYGQAGILIKGSGEGSNGGGLSSPLLFDVVTSSGNSVISYSEGVNSTVVQGGSSFWDTAALQATSAATGATALRASGIAGQTADIFQVSTDTTSAHKVFSVSSSGNVSIQGNVGINQTSGSNALGVTGAGSFTTHVYAPDFDVVSAGTLTIGTTNATTINLATNNIAHTIAIANGTGAQSVTIGSTDTTSGLILQGGNNGIAQVVNSSGSFASYIGGLGGTQVFATDNQGRVTFRPVSDTSTPSFQVKDTSGNSVFNVNTMNDTTYGGYFLQTGAGGLDTSGAAGLNIGVSTYLGAAPNATTITLGSTGTTSTITVGQSTVTNTINIGNNTIAAGNTGTINIGTSATGLNGKVNLTLGSTNDGSTTNIQGGTGNVNLITNSASAGVIVKSNTNSVTAFVVQNSSPAAIFTVDTSGSQIIIGNGANNVTISTGGGFVASGTAQHTKSITLTPEYAGAVLDAQNDTGGSTNCSTTNNGSMTSGFVNTGRQNYYNWIATPVAAQCYDVVVQIPIPADWSSWSGAPSMFTYNSVGTDATSVMVDVIDSTGTNDTAYSATAYNGVTSGTTFSSNNLTTLTGSYSANGYLTLKIRLTSNSSKNVRIGNITLNYKSNY